MASDIEITADDIIDAFEEVRRFEAKSDSDVGHSATVEKEGFGLHYVDGLVDFGEVARALSKIVVMKLAKERGEVVNGIFRFSESDPAVIDGLPEPGQYGLETARQRIFGD